MSLFILTRICTGVDVGLPLAFGCAWEGQGRDRGAEIETLAAMVLDPCVAEMKRGISLTVWPVVKPS